MLGLCRFLSPACVAPAIIALIAVTPASAEPLQPTGKWHLFYQESNCSAERAFGDHMFGIQPSPLGKTMRLVIVGPGRILRTRQLDSLIELSDGGPPIKTSSLVYATSKKGMRGITTVLPLAEAERVSLMAAYFHSRHDTEEQADNTFERANLRS